MKLHSDLKSLITVWACLGVNQLDMFGTPYWASEGKHPSLRCLLKGVVYYIGLQDLHMTLTVASNQREGI